MQIDALQIVFLVGAAVTLGCSLMVVSSKNLFHSALWLIGALFGVAILFVLLDAGFLAAAQVVLYIGAIATLIIIAVMLTRRVMQPPPEAANAEWPLAVAGTALLFALLAAPLGPFFPGMAFRVKNWIEASRPLGDASGSLVTLGKALVDASMPAAQSPEALRFVGVYAVPFELASLLLLGALVGSIVIAREKW